MHNADDDDDISFSFPENFENLPYLWGSVECLVLCVERSVFGQTGAKILFELCSTTCKKLTDQV